jgi:hypothetical protein
MKNNLAAAPLTVTPVLRLASGQEVPLTPVTIPANASVSTSVNDGLQEHAPYLLGRAGSYGSVVFRFTSFHAMNLHATAVPSFHGEPVALRVHAHPAVWDPADTLRADGPGSLEGIWWQPRSGLNDVLVISNSSDTTVNGALSLFDGGGKRWSEPLSFGPHQTERMEMSALLQKAGLSGSFGGISFEVPAAAAAIDGAHLMYDEAGKFSTSLEMFSRDPRATVRERTGSEQKQWVMRAPMLALHEPDPALDLPPGTKLQPTIFLRNATGQNVSANITLSWRGDSGKGQAKLPVLQLAPFATQQIQVWAMQKQLGIPEDAHWAMVSLTTNAAPDDVIAIASSRDCTGTYDVGAKFIGGQGGRFAGGEWRADTTHNYIAAITNVGTKATDALLTLHYDNGGKKYELQQTVAPGEQMWVNLAQLIRGRVTDRKGNLLPVDVSAVTYDVQELTPGGSSLMASDLAVNSALGQVVPNCISCCGYSQSSASFNPYPVDVIINDLETVGITAVNTCSGWKDFITVDIEDWWTNNPNIAQMTTAQVQGISVGSTTGFAEGTVNGPGQCACNPRLVEISVPIYVGSLTCPSSVARGATATCTVSPPGVTVSGWTFKDGQGNTVTRPSNTSSLTWSGTMVTGGTVTATTSGGSPSASITVTNRNWHTNPASPAEVPNGTFITLPVPPQNTGTDSGLGYFQWHYVLNSGSQGLQYSTINDNGPIEFRII